MDQIKQYRQQVDKIDEQILQALGERAKICRAIGLIKKEKDLPIRDTDREKQVYRRVREKAAISQLDPKQVEAVYREIVNMCSAVQE
jgi:chorismate mutase